MNFLAKGTPWSVVVIPPDQGSTNQNRPVPEPSGPWAPV